MVLSRQQSRLKLRPSFGPTTPTRARGCLRPSRVRIGPQAAAPRSPLNSRHPRPVNAYSYGDDGITYRYSGSDYSALPWTPTLLEIKARIEEVYGNYNYCLLNLYRNGQDSMGTHADNEPEMGNVIGSLSLGATREFRISKRSAKPYAPRGCGAGTAAEPSSRGVGARPCRCPGGVPAFASLWPARSARAGPRRRGNPYCKASPPIARNCKEKL
jgi:hypothetical protein